MDGDAKVTSKVSETVVAKVSGREVDKQPGDLTVAARTNVQVQHRSFDTQRGSAHLDPTGQPGERAAQRAQQKARAWLERKRNPDVYLNLLSERKGFSDLIVMALEGELMLDKTVRNSRRRRRLAWVLSQQYLEREREKEFKS